MTDSTFWLTHHYMPSHQTNASTAAINPSIWIRTARIRS